MILSLLKTLHLKCDHYARLHLVCTRDLHRAGQAHRELFDACKTEDPEIAATEMWKHITEAGNK